MQHLLNNMEVDADISVSRAYFLFCAKIFANRWVCNVDLGFAARVFVDFIKHARRDIIITSHTRNRCSGSYHQPPANMESLFGHTARRIQRHASEIWIPFVEYSTYRMCVREQFTREASPARSPKRYVLLNLLTSRTYTPVPVRILRLGKGELQHA